MTSISDEDEPTAKAAEARPKRVVPPQLRPGFRTPEQIASLVAADQAAWASIARFRFAAPSAIQRLHFSPAKLGFELGEHAFKGRMGRHIAKGYWVAHRLGSRPESVISLTRRGTELVEATYGTNAPAWNVDSGRRGWLRSIAWANLSGTGAIETGAENLKRYTKNLDSIRQNAIKQLKAGEVPGSNEFVAMLDKLATGETPVATYDYSRANRTILLVEDPHKSVESQIETLRQVKSGMTNWSTQIIYRPVDELSAWSPSRHDWVRRSGRLAKALSLLRENGFVLVEAPEVPHMQTEGS